MHTQVNCLLCQTDHTAVHVGIILKMTEWGPDSQPSCWRGSIPSLSIGLWHCSSMASLPWLIVYLAFVI